MRARVRLSLPDDVIGRPIDGDSSGNVFVVGSTIPNLAAFGDYLAYRGENWTSIDDEAFNQHVERRIHTRRGEAVGEIAPAFRLHFTPLCPSAED